MGEEYIECKSRRNLVREIYANGRESRIPLKEGSRSNRSFHGFHYFGPGTLNSPTNAKIIIARESDDPKDIIGVIKLGMYNHYGELPNFWAACYADVRKDRQLQGVVTRLNGALNEFSAPNDYLTGTRLSEMGEKADLHRLMKRMVTICPVFDSGDDFYDYCKERNLLKKQ